MLLCVQLKKMDTKKRNKRAKAIGANQYSSPDVGEAYGIFQVGGTQVHFAPVIAKSGADHVTLENYAGNPGSSPSPVTMGTSSRPPVNPNWFFRMLGPVKKHTFKADEDQTFWGEHRRIEAANYGTKPLVVTMGSQ